MRVFTKEVGGRSYWIGSFKVGATWKQKSIPAEVAKLPEDGEKALEWLKNYLANSKPAPVVTKPVESINSLYEKVLPLIQAQYSKAIITQTEQGYKNHIKNYAIAGKSIDSLTIPEGRAYVRELMENNKHLAPYTLRNILQSARIIVKTCRAEGMSTGVNVFGEKEVLELLPTGKPISDEVIALPNDVSRQLFKICANNEEHLYIAVALATGVRSGELLALTYENIAEEHNVRYFNIVKQFSKCEKSLKLPKKGKTRRVPVHSELAKAIAGKTGRITDITSGDNLATKLRNILGKNGLPTHHANGEAFTFHSLRRSFMSLLVEADVEDEVTRQRLLGHSGKNVTQVHYTPTILTSLNNAVQSMKLEV